MRRSKRSVGIPDNPIEDVRLENIRIDYAGGGTEKMAATRPSDQVKEYPEPAKHGPTPSYGFFVRHVNNLELSNIRLAYATEEVRPPFVIENVRGAEFVDVKAQPASNGALFVLRSVENFATHRVQGVADARKDRVDQEKF
jgi:hypothetical protein